MEPTMIFLCVHYLDLEHVSLSVFPSLRFNRIAFKKNLISPIFLTPEILECDNMLYI